MYLFLMRDGTVVSMFEKDGSSVCRPVMQQLVDPASLARESQDPSYLLNQLVGVGVGAGVGGRGDDIQKALPCWLGRVRTRPTRSTSWWVWGWARVCGAAAVGQGQGWRHEEGPGKVSNHSSRGFWL